MSDLLQAILQLDPSNNDQWTTDGLPRVEAISEIYGKPVTRKEVTEAKPGFSRAVAIKNPIVVNTPENENTLPVGENSDEKPIDAPVDTQVETQQSDLGTTEQVEQEVNQVESELEIAKKKLEAKKAEQTQINKEVAELQKEFDLLRIVEEKANHKSHAETIQSYLESQKRIAIERSALQKQLVDKGIDVSGLSKQLQISPLDQSLKGKR